AGDGPEHGVFVAPAVPDPAFKAGDAMQCVRGCQEDERARQCCVSSKNANTSATPTTASSTAANHTKAAAGEKPAVSKKPSTMGLMVVKPTNLPATCGKKNAPAAMRSRFQPLVRSKRPLDIS